ncbi:MAG TPA: hypothetical protein VEZ71_04925 [Archangium sp.]|nr:hypothetical protein [Archangium sp.]
MSNTINGNRPVNTGIVPGPVSKSADSAAQSTPSTATSTSGGTSTVKLGTDSFQVASARGTVGGMPMGHLDIRTANKYGQVSITPATIRHGKIEITTRPINMQALTQRGLDAAVVKKNADDVRAYGKSTAELKQAAIKDGYFNSVGHNAWAKAAEARTGGRIPASFWKEFDPFGGTAGNGPNIELTGKYPGLASLISMAHDTDWSLGRYFNTGPLQNLYGQQPKNKDDMKSLGMAGLVPQPIRFPNLDLYTNGRPDWNVKYH